MFASSAAVLGLKSGYNETQGRCCAAEGETSPPKQGGSPSKQGGSPSKQGGTRGGLFGSGGGDKGSGGEGGSSWLPTWAGGAKKPEEKVVLLLLAPTLYRQGACWGGFVVSTCMIKWCRWKGIHCYPYL